jgi:glycosyltransferase involved in cell wall biosynthesis
MRVSLVNKWDIGGGAARAAFRLAVALRTAGVDVTYHAQEKQAEHDWVQLRQGNSTGQEHEDRIQAYMDQNRTACSNTYFSHSTAMLDSRDLQHIAAADIINLHWVEKFLSTQAIAALLASEKPIVWTLHDQRPLTGGCHYTAGCEQFSLAGCSRCIQLRGGGKDIPAANLRDKISLLRGANITLVTPSAWLGQQARKSALFRDHRIEVIPNSVETEVFRPTNKAIAREALGLPQDRFVLLFGVHDAREQRKGYTLLLEAMRHFLRLAAVTSSQPREPLVLVFGSGVSDSWDLPVERHCAGEIRDDTTLAQIYSAADVFVIPSSEDNLPNTVLEAMACGTPCVGFPVGGIPEMIREGETGFTTPLVSARALAHSLLQAYSDPVRLEDLAVACTDVVRKEYTQERQGRRYLELFTDLVSGR